MWAGMVEGEYDVGSGRTRHVPSGMSLAWPASVRFEEESGPHILLFADRPGLQAKLWISRYSNNVRAEEMQVSYSGSEARGAFRRRFGNMCQLDRVAVEGGVLGPVRA